jgi:hypothetical protein
MKLLKYLGALVLVVVLLYTFLVKSSAVVSKFECSGGISSEGGSHPVTVYMQLEEYRWWVGLWSDSNGNLRIEIPNKTIQYYGHVVKAGSQLQIFYRQNDPRGNFSTLSKALALSTPNGFFDGTCKRVD